MSNPPSAKEQFPEAPYDPLPGHKKCNGLGMYRVRKHWSPCICIYMDHTLLHISEPAMDAAFKDVLGEEYDEV